MATEAIAEESADEDSFEEVSKAKKAPKPAMPAEADDDEEQ